LVAIDGSESSSSAFEYAMTEALSRKKGGDEVELYLLGIIEPVDSCGSCVPVSTGATEGQQANTQTAQQPEKEMRSILNSFRNKANDLGVFRSETSILRTSSHIGKLICDTCEFEQVDLLIIGRRGLGKSQRHVLGSVSNYCVANAPCAVLVARGNPLTEAVHEPIVVIDRLEQQERDRRVREHAVVVSHDSLAGVIAAEESERQRRLVISDGNAEAQLRGFHSALNHNVTIMGEEQERRRRIEARDSELQRREHAARVAILATQRDGGNSHSNSLVEYVI